MKTIFDLQTGVVTLLCTAALAGLTACEADPVMQESGKLPDKGSIEEVHAMLCSSNSVENRVDVLLTEGGVMTKNFYFMQTKPAAAGYSLYAWCDASLLNDYDAGDEIERTLLPEANYEFPDGKTLDLSAATQRSELKRIKFSASGLAAGEYVLPLTVAAQDAPARPLGQRELQRGQQGLHHLRLDSEEDEVAPACHLVVDRGIAAQFGGQFLRLGSGAVGQIHVLRVCCFAHRAGNGPAHVAAA